MTLSAPELEARMAALRLAVFDVDGVMTDGRLFYGPDGETHKTFNVRDGYGLVSLARAGVHTAVITGRNSAAVAKRMEELNCKFVFQGISEKLTCLRALVDELSLEPAEICYMGDDIPDLEALRYAGIGAAVADAEDSVRLAADWVSGCRGGDGAVRELCDRILDARSRGG